MSFDYPKVDPGVPTFEFDAWDVYSPKANTLYDFRIDHRAADGLHGSLIWFTAYPTYFGRPKKFTDEAGVFDVLKATLYVNGEVSEEDP